MEKQSTVNKKLDYETELLVITMEECGEMIEASLSSDTWNREVVFIQGFGIKISRSIDDR